MYEEVAAMHLETQLDAEGILHVTGELDLNTADALVRSGTAALGRSPDLTLDLSDLSFTDSSGIRAFLTLAERARGSVVLRRPNDSVRKVIQMTGIVGRNGIVLEE
jgi:anti-anti-sigma factor